MNKKNTPNRRRITDPQFSQPMDFIAATGYGNIKNHLDSYSNPSQFHLTHAGNRKVSKETLPKT